ncbi:MAG: hypothetical protein JWL69_4601 [Phycisphaerales bacterium]|nr:hypothetical protein [Phycisphaerales bacterium]
MALLADLLDPIKEYLKDKPLWHKVEPAFVLLVVYLAANAAVWEFYQRESHIELPLGLYLQSYLFKRLTIAFAFTACALILLFRKRRRSGPGAPPARQRFARILRARWRAAARSVAILGLLAIALVIVMRRFSPYHPAHVRIVFLDTPDAHFDRYAFGYLVYEVNRAQTDWHFEVDYKEVNPGAFSTEQEKRFAGDDGLLALASWKADGQPCIGITTRPFNDHAFWMNRDQCSVISTADWQRLKPPGTYDYLMFTVVLQGMVIHLNQTGGGLPPGAYAPDRPERGSVLDFAQRRGALKPSLLAGRLEPDDQRLLLNRFGPEYLNTTLTMLKLDWMHTPAVVANLKTFGVKDVAAAQPAPGESP